VIVRDATVVFWVVLGCTILMILTVAAFWWGTRPSIWDERDRPSE
jgi:hypothetical protein